MNKFTDSTSLSVAPVTSRRRFLSMATTASVAAVMPIAALAEADHKTSRLPQTLDERLAACIDQLREIMAEMHPGISTMHDHYLSSRKDGSFRFCLQGDVEFQPYQGDGIYLVSIDGWPSEYLVREERIVTLSGRDLGHSHYFGRARADDGGWDDYERWVSNFVSKLGEVPA